MLLTAFKIQKYRSILDSGWIDVPQLTAIVGKNESGKTSLLKALHKFNPYRPEPYVISREWPRGHRREQTDKQVVCACRFQLSPDEKAALSDLSSNKITTDSVEVSRDYGGRLEVVFPDAIFPDALHPNDIDKICEQFPSIPDSVSAPFKAAAEECQAKTRRLAHEGHFTDLPNLAAEHQTRLAEHLSPQQPQRQWEDQYRAAYHTKMQELGPKLAGLRTIQAQAHEYIVDQLPTFIYMDDYRAFAGTAHLDDVKQRKDANRSTEEDKTLTMILELSGLDIEDEFKNANSKDREQRQYDLDDAGKTLTREIADRWKQKKYEVQFRADGFQFFTMVQDDPNVGLIRLEERSKGFQWFFSFDLLFMHESKGDFRDCVILLDEPGLHLHPDGQTDLLARLDEYAKDNVLIYTTHLPFMLDLRHPERIKIIVDTPMGATVSDNLVESNPESKLTLQAALGMGGRTSYLVAQRNLVVEGVDDFWILTELSNLFNRSGRNGLPEDLFITAAGGASEAAYIATFMVGQRLEVVVLLDSDQAGNDARDRLVKRWLTRYSAKESSVLSLGLVCSAVNQEYSIEDIFADSFYVAAVEEVYRSALALSGTPIKLIGTGQLCKRVERALAGSTIHFNKGSVAKVLRKRIAQMKTVDELPKETVEAAGKIFGAVERALLLPDPKV